MFSLREYREPTKRLPDYLPWAALIAPGVVLQKDGIIQKTIAFRGPDLASSSDAELLAATARLNNALKRLGSGWTLFMEAQRFESSYYPNSTWPHPVAALIDAERRLDHERRGNHYESSYFCTFVYQLPAARNLKVQNLFFDDPDKNNPAEENDRDLQNFLKTVAEITDIMRGVFVEVAPLNDDETLSYLHSTISTNRHPLVAPAIPMYLDALLPDVAFTPGDIPMLGEYFMPTCTINKFPTTTLPGILDDLNYLGTEYRWVARFICLDQQDARREIEKMRKRWWGGRKNLWTLLKEEASKEESQLLNTAAANKAADADAALQELGEDLLAFGYMTTTITVWDRDLETARKKMQLVKQAVQSKGFTARDETLNSTQAWLGSLPGHVYANVRRPLISTLNLAHLLPLSAVWAGDDLNGHLQEVSTVGDAHVYCTTTGSTPFRLNLNVQDVGHGIILGPTGSGKSTLLSTLGAQWLKYPNAQVFIFDKDRSARALTMALGGAYYEPGNDTAPGWQPLGDITTRDERIWAAEFLLLLLTLQSVPESPATKQAIDDVLHSLAAAPAKERTITMAASLLGSHRSDLGQALRPYTLEGNYGFIFDAKHDELRASSWTCFEMGRLMSKGEEVIVPALSYLFHRIEQQFNGRPTLLILDEAWLFMSHKVFADRLLEWLKTLRKKNVYVVFATQELADLMRPERQNLRSTIISATASKIYLPDPNALEPLVAETYQAFGLSDAERNILATAQPKAQYYYRSVKGRRLFNLGLGPIALTFVGASSPDDQALMNSLEAAQTPIAAYPEEMLRARKLNSGIELLHQLQTAVQTN